MCDHFLFDCLNVDYFCLQLVNENKTLKQELEELKASLALYEQEKNRLASNIELLEQRKAILEQNISMLYRTAKTEMKRKMKMIEELRTEYVNMVIFTRIDNDNVDARTSS